MPRRSPPDLVFPVVPPMEKVDYGWVTDMLDLFSCPECFWDGDFWEAVSYCGPFEVTKKSYDDTALFCYFKNRVACEKSFMPFRSGFSFCRDILPGVYSNWLKAP